MGESPSTCRQAGERALKIDRSLTSKGEGTIQDLRGHWSSDGRAMGESMTDEMPNGTQRVDAKWASLVPHSYSTDVGLEMRDFARQLERELNEARAKLAALLTAKPNVAGLVEATDNWLAGHAGDSAFTLLPRLRDALLALSAQLAERDKMLATMRPFFNEHALGPKMRPSCLVCGRNDYKAVAVSHAELPGIVVCDTCKSAQSQLQEKEAECEGLRRDAERWRLLTGLFKLEIQRLLRAHLGIAGGSIDTLTDAAIDARKT